MVRRVSRLSRRRGAAAGGGRYRRLARTVGVAGIVGPALGGVVCSLLVLAAVILVLGRRLDPMGAAMVGGLALVAVEVGTAVGRSSWVPSVGGGTQVGRAWVLAAATGGGLLVSLVVDPHASPRQDSLALGLLAVAALVMAVAAAVARPWTSQAEPAAADESGSPEGFPGRCG